jgi:hypothetical protein
MLEKDTLLTASAILGSLGVLVGLWFAIYAPPPTSGRKHLMFIGAFTVLLIPCGVYLYSAWSSQISGDFEWQWAGENWIGSVQIVEERNERVAKVDMKSLRKEFQPNGSFTYHLDQFFRFAKGTVDGDRDGFKLSIELVHSKTNQRLQLDAELKPVLAYAGIARYRLKDGIDQNGGTGDIILVRHRSPARSW